MPLVVHVFVADELQVRKLDENLLRIRHIEITLHDHDLPPMLGHLLLTTPSQQAIGLVALEFTKGLDLAQMRLLSLADELFDVFRRRLKPCPNFSS